MKGLVHNQFIWKLGKLREMDEYQNSLLLLLEFIVDYPVYSRPEIPKKYLAWKKLCSLNNLRNPGYTGTSFWKQFCTWVLRMCIARWWENMADEEDDDPVVAEVCLSHVCEDPCTVYRDSTVHKAYILLSFTGGRLFGPGFGQQSLLISGKDSWILSKTYNMRKLN